MELNGEELAFVRAIAAAPGDLLPRQAYADFLDDLGDPRGEYLRLTVRYANEYLHYDDRAATVTRLIDLADQLDRTWRAAFDPGPRAFTLLRKSSPRLALPLRSLPWPNDWPTHRERGGPFPVYLYAAAASPAGFDIHARMRFARIETRSPFIRAIGTEGTPGPPRPVPPEWLAEFRYSIPHKPRWRTQRVVPPGTVRDPGRFYAVNLVDPGTAFRFDCLLNGWV